MRDAINILWVEDSEEWGAETLAGISDNLAEMNINVNWKIISNGNDLIQQLESYANEFNYYDIFLIDYNLSLEIDDGNKYKKVYGNDIIDILRKNEVDADILFYSSDSLKTIREIVSNQIGDYGGVYTSNRDEFNYKVIKLVNKNIRKSFSITNIRGFLTNETSENDYIVNSIINKGFKLLDKEKKKEILSDLKKYAKYNSDANEKQFQDVIDRIGTYDKLLLEDEEKINIRQIFKNHSSAFKVMDVYNTFGKISNYLNPEFMKQFNLEIYLRDIVMIRNTLAHKKLDLCERKKYIKYADDFKQTQDRLCNSCSDHSDKYKLSVQEWEALRNQTIDYSRLFDSLFLKVFDDKVQIK